MARFSISCPACRAEHSFEGTLSFREECERCAADLHVCLTCRFHDEYADNECRETQADPVQQKDRRNLCEYYKPLAPGDAGEYDEAAAAKAKLAALFGGAPGAVDAGATVAEPAVDDHRAKLAALFKKRD